MSSTSKHLNDMQKGVTAALCSALFLGMSPVFGKQAINLGLSFYAVVALRTCLGAWLLFVEVVI